MRKATTFPIFFFIFTLLLPLTGHSVSSRAVAQELTVLAADSKSTPAENALSEVRRQIAASYKPATTSASPVILDRSPDIKKKPARAFASSSVSSAGSFHRKLSARSAIIIDAQTGEEIYSHNPDLPRQPASTIKVLTGLIAIDSLKNDSLVSVSNWAASMPRSKIYIQQGRSYYADDLINAVLLASANDASVALAEKIAGSESGFADMMTRKAYELGATKTVCKTASGLTANGQQTTARDLAMIFRKAMQNQEFSDRMKRLKARTSYGKTLRSHNKAMWQISGSQGGKTGYTWAAKQTYVGKFSRNGREILVAILGSRNMWSDISKLVDFGFSRTQSPRVAGRDENRSTPEDKTTTIQSGLVVLNGTKKTAAL